MPCPYFYPEKKAEGILWNHNSRLPLGTGWEGRCCAPGHSDDNTRVKPSEDDLCNRCNLGYAAGCLRLPREPEADAVRFGLVRSEGSLVSVHFVRERNHLPLDHGMLVFDSTTGKWSVGHPNQVLQRQAECFLESWREKESRVRQASA